MLEGVVLEIVPGGLAYVEERGSKKRFAFTFGKIRDYRGETAQELGLRVGSRSEERRVGKECRL